MRSIRPITELVFLCVLLRQTLRRPTDTSGQDCPYVVANMATTRKRVSLSRAHRVVTAVNVNYLTSR